MAVINWGSGNVLSSNITNSKVAALKDGGYVVAWNEGPAVEIQRFDARGIAFGPQKVFGGAQDAQIVGTDSGGFAVSYTQNYSGTDSDPLYVRYDVNNQYILGGDLESSSNSLDGQTSIAASGDTSWLPIETP